MLLHPMKAVREISYRRGGSHEVRNRAQHSPNVSTVVQKSVTLGESHSTHYIKREELQPLAQVKYLTVRSKALVKVFEQTLQNVINETLE